MTGSLSPSTQNAPQLQFGNGFRSMNENPSAGTDENDTSENVSHIAALSPPMTGPPPQFENVLAVPTKLTKHAQNVLFSRRASPLSYHLEGRFGSRTHRIDAASMGIPVLDSTHLILDLAARHDDLYDLIHHTEDVRVCRNPYVPPPPHRAREPPEIDATIHPERRPNSPTESTTTTCHPSRCGTSASTTKLLPPSKCGTSASPPLDGPVFTYAELFAGMGGFGVALDALGGRCVFCSELEEHLRAVYRHNFVALPNQRRGIHSNNNKHSESDNSPFDIPTYGDIYQVRDTAFPNSLDILVGGFPCQPFSALGEQSGLGCVKSGNLFQEIVRCLKVSKPQAFLLENVPGLLTMADTYQVIVEALTDAGYDVTSEVCSARGLTASGRKRLFLVGLRRHGNRGEDHESGHDEDRENTVSDSNPSRSPRFEFPFVPDLQIRSRDVLDYDDLPPEELKILRLTDDTFDQLLNCGRWRPHSLAWPNKTCETLISHYGNAVGRGESQLVPCSAPHAPRRFSVRECARLMGFPNSYEFLEPREHQSPMGYRKEQYRMIGNAVCPPLIAALAGAVLHHCRFGDPSIDNWDWVQRGREVAVQLALAATRPEPARLPRGCLLPCEYSKYCKSSNDIVDGREEENSVVDS